MPPRCPASLLLLAAAAAAGLRAAAPVAARSPFLPPAGAAAESKEAAGNLEFHGFVDVGEGKQFRLFDPGKKKSAWLRLNERSEELDATVRQHQEGEENVTVEHQGRTVTLAMRRPKIVAQAAPAVAPGPVGPVVPAGPAITVAPAVTQSVVVNPSPADEQRRLEAVAAEVARRRALRDQAMRQPGAPDPAAVPAPIPPPQSR